MDDKGEKVADFIRIDDKNYIKMVTKYVEEEFSKMMKHIDFIDNILLSNSSELSYKVDAIIYEKLMTFYKILLYSNNNTEYFLEEKHDDRFIEEVRHIVNEKIYRILKNNLPNKNLKETLNINHNYFAELLKLKVDEVVAKIKLSSSEEIVNDNQICILQLAIFKGLINKTMSDYYLETDNVRSFLKDRNIENNFVSTVYEQYERYCKDDISQEPVGKNLFGARLKLYGYVSQVQTTTKSGKKTSRRIYVKDKTKESVTL